jgi:hypothetical protein
MVCVSGADCFRTPKPTLLKVIIDKDRRIGS